jgi:hypothetical protein
MVLPEPQSWIVRAAHVLLVLIGMGVSSELAATADTRRFDVPERRTPPVTTSKA